MEKKGFNRPWEVWYDNLMGILDHTSTSEEEWFLSLQERVYPEAAIWAQMIMRCKYPILCTPSEDHEEFMLTEGAYSLHEGPPEPEAWVEFHVICVVSPRLTVLMRDILLPEIIEDREESKRLSKQVAHADHLKPLSNPQDAHSIFHDLVVVKPRVGKYISTGSGDINLVTDPMADTEGDRLCLPIFRIGSPDVQSLNSVILHEALDFPDLVSAPNLPYSLL
ncbi:hypothetical protein K491DRAFT_750516 [Lophiostoma macrostomum CBS 122681]|uniref:Uncharacterized protein n=1 Tax=Lophiostoma macrostomum CBS 122681 TaxID=1314788 RepID=A0A6A6T1U5_9PLEO|nr:hypothetical protein K491DRAFT_750516 [Lophiostoma macrostomum CBS 122681]